MNKLQKILCLLLAILITLPTITVLTSCSGPKTSENNPLYLYEEVREFNMNSKIPYIFGTKRSEFGNEYVLRGGTINHHETYLSRDNTDVTYYLSTYELNYGYDKVPEELYVTAVRVRAKNKTIQLNDDGSRTPIYETDRSILGVKVGNTAEEAGDKLESYGYTKIYEETPTSNFPQSLEHAYKKGIIVISLAVENSGEVSSIYAWIPYDTSKIDEVFTDCILPCNLGTMYNMHETGKFEYSEKTETFRVYTSKDGSIAVLSGFPDILDTAMVSELIFTSPEYSVSSVCCGMSFKQAKDALLASGWEYSEQNHIFTKALVTLELYDVDNVKFSDRPSPISNDNAIIKTMKLSLLEATKLEEVNKTN